MLISLQIDCLENQMLVVLYAVFRSVRPPEENQTPVVLYDRLDAAQALLDAAQALLASAGFGIQLGRC